MTNALGIVIENNRPVVSSRKVAEVFEKQHKHVMESIRELIYGDEFGQSNFRPSSYINSQNKEQPEYLMTRDGFTLLAMGFTGSKAMQWKIKYITAFNKMEEDLATPFTVPKSLPDALRLAAEIEEKRLVLEAQITEEKPYTDLGKAVLPEQEETSVGQMATIISQKTGVRISRNDLFCCLRNTNWICSTTYEWNRPRQTKIDNGCMKYRSEIHGRKVTYTPFFTPKGVKAMLKAYIEG